MIGPARIAIPEAYLGVDAVLLLVHNIAAGLVVDGGIYRHEFVSEAVIGALMRLQLDLEIPIISAVLTPQHFHEHEDHRRFFHEHFKVKGREAAQACAQTLANIERVRQRP